MKYYGDMSRFMDSASGITTYTNDTLICRDCVYRYAVVGSCEKYPHRKPEGILDDTQMCPHYRGSAERR